MNRFEEGIESLKLTQKSGHENYERVFILADNINIIED